MKLPVGLWLVHALSTPEKSVSEQKQLNFSHVLTDGIRRAAVSWPGEIPAPSIVNLLPTVLEPTAADALVALAATIPFDEDSDTVDGEPTYELYLEKNGNEADIAAIPGKPDRDPKVAAARAEVRGKARSIISSTVTQLVELVNQLYPDECNGSGGCRVCHSLLRRYMPSERRAHAPHFDIQALITVVVGLNEYGTDFGGGLFVTTTGTERQFIALPKGAAVVHQSTLLHGVNVTWGSRWSWIMWFKNGKSCTTSDPTNWNAAAAERGDPLAQFLLAHRMHLGLAGEDRRLAGPKDVEMMLAKKASWLHKAAEGGFARAMNEYGVACMNGAGVEMDTDLAMSWFSRAAFAGEPDGHYNLGLLALGRGDEAAAVTHFRTGAEVGSTQAMFNFAVALYQGRGVEQDHEAAATWFEREGGAESLSLLSTIVDNPVRANAFRRRAAAAGDRAACHTLVLAAMAAEEGNAVGRRWLECATKGADADALFELGHVWFNKDLVIAMDLFRRSAILGSKRATILLQSLGRVDL